MRQGRMNIDLLLARAGVNYRQFDYWCRKGWINAGYHSRRHGDPSDGGSGSSRNLDEREAEILLRMGRLVTRGFTPYAAAKIARAMVDTGSDTVKLAGDLTVRLELSAPFEVVV